MVVQFLIMTKIDFIRTQLHHSLQQKAAKRNSLLLSMDEISGKLSELKDTVIAMPGISTADQEVSNTSQ